jgi:hypothetical protein
MTNQTRVSNAQLLAELKAQNQFNTDLLKQVSTLTSSVLVLTESLALSASPTAVTVEPSAKPKKAKKVQPKAETCPVKISNALAKAKSLKQSFSGKDIDDTPIEYGVLNDRDWTWVYSYPKPSNELVAAIRSELALIWGKGRQGHFVKTSLTARQVQLGINRALKQAKLASTAK